MTRSFIDEITDKQYPYGFVTPIDSDTFAPGLNETVVRQISAKKKEPGFMLNWRLKAFEYWQTLTPPTWAALTCPPIDYQNISYYAAPKSTANAPKSLEEVDLGAA